MSKLKHIISKIFGNEVLTEHSFRLLVHTYQEKVFRFIGLFVRDKQECEELSSDVFLSLWNNRDNLSSIESLENYLFIVAKNKALNHLRKKRVNFVDIDDIEIDYFYSTRSTPESIYIDQEAVYALNQIIDQLPTKTKLAFLLVRENNMKYKDAAEILGVSVKTLEKQVASAVFKLKEKLSR